MDNQDTIKILNQNQTSSYQAAIVEDDPEMLHYIKDSLAESFQKEHVQMAFDSFTSGMGFLNMVNEHYHYDIIFLDIEMPEIDGIEICRQVKSIVPDALVVFISGKEELVFQTFEVQPFRFIRKSQYKTQLPSLTRACAEQFQKKNRHILQLIEPYSGDIYSFYIHKIRFIEAQGKKCMITTDTEKVAVNCRFMELEAFLESYHFLKPHRSYLVNSSCIFHISKNSVILDDHTEIPISRSRSEIIKLQFLKYNS